MCGIFGWQLKKNKLLPLEKRMIVAVALGWQNEARGTDSYGWCNTDTYETTRGVGRIAGKAKNMAVHPSLIGHTRKSTTGASTVENAHPFSIGDVIGAHNGIIHNHSELNTLREKAGKKPFDVDSQHIFAALDQEWNIKHLSGYGAIEWVDKRNPGKVFICKISHTGDLCVVSTPYGVFWSSDDDHLKEAMLLAGIKYTEMESKAEKIYFVENGQYYKTNNVLELKTYSHQATVYGSSQREREMWEDWIESRFGRRADGNGDFFRGLSKKQRKRLIKESNARLKASHGGSSSVRLYKYTDLCACGALVGDGEPHMTHCDKFKPYVIIDKTGPCTSCGQVEHLSWCENFTGAKKSIGFVNNARPTPIMLNKRADLKGVRIGGVLNCPTCYNIPRPDDQECPNGHGRVVGEV